MKNSTYVLVNSKGQIAIPAVLRRKLGIEAGARFQVSEESGRIVLERIVTRADIRRVRGMLKGSGALKVLMTERRRDREREG